VVDTASDTVGEYDAKTVSPINGNFIKGLTQPAVIAVKSAAEIAQFIAPLALAGTCWSRCVVLTVKLRCSVLACWGPHLAAWRTSIRVEQQASILGHQIRQI
jgi:hypothetical protein